MTSIQTLYLPFKYPLNYLEYMHCLSVLHLGPESLQGELVRVVVPLPPDVAPLHDDTVAVVGVGLRVHVEGDPQLGQQVGGHAHPPLPRTQ